MAKKKGGRKRAKSSGPQSKGRGPETPNDDAEAHEPDDERDEDAASAGEEPETAKAAGDAESEPGEDAEEGADDPDAKKPASKESKAAKTPKAAKPPPPSEDDDDDPGEKVPDAAPKPGAAGDPAPQAWARTFVTIEKAITWFEVRLLVVIILSLVFALVAWISLSGMSSPVQSQSSAGVVFRGFFGATVLGALAAGVTRYLKTSKAVASVAGAIGIIVGFVAAPSWRENGVEYFGHIQNWLQEGSSLTMFGGLRGVSTRFTIILAFLGGSLAAASGKHINIDVLLRFVDKRFKLKVFVLQTIATVAFCVVASWAFFEYIAITNFNAPLESSRMEKVEVVRKAVSQDMFLYRKQIGFDLSATSHVLGGGKWDDESRLNGRQWNEFLDSSGYADYFTKEQVDALRARPDSLESSRLALAVGPEGQPRNQLVRTMNLTFTVGFLMMGIRFLLRLILVMTGHQKLDEEEAS